MKRLITFSVLLLLSTNMFAQLFTIAGREIGFVYVGPKLGMNFSKFSQWSYDNVDVKNRMGYQFGVVGDIGLTKKLSFQTEINFISKGTKGVDNSGFTEIKRMPAIQIPLLARYAFSFLGLKRVYANGGAYSTTRVGSGTIVYEDEGFTYDDYHWTRFDWGLSLGCGAEYPVDKGIWGLDLRYDLGFVDIYRQNDENTKSRFRSFQFSLTYKFDLVDLFTKNDEQTIEP
ncbi:MAG TPA: porin family protein [Tenuifilaceae bacterium]|nr:porin family protein [Tenuifilaceae bacterium]